MIDVKLDTKCLFLRLNRLKHNKSKSSFIYGLYGPVGHKPFPRAFCYGTHIKLHYL